MTAAESSARPGFVLTVDERTPALLTLAGAQPRLTRFEPGTSVLYPSEPQDTMATLEALRAAVDQARVFEKAQGARRVTVLISDPAYPQPAMRDDARATIATLVLDDLARARVDDVALVFATGLGRTLSAPLAERLLGERIWRSFAALDAVHSHDAEAEDLVTIGSAGGVDVAINRRLAESDLIVNIRLVAERGWACDEGAQGWVDVAVQASSTATVQAIRGAQARPDAARDIAALLRDKLPMTTIAAVVGQPAYRGPLHFIGEREWEWKTTDKLAYRAVRRALATAPDPTARRLYRELGADYAVVGLLGGDPDEVARASARCLEQTQQVPAPAPADVLALGVRHPNPAGDGSISNPVAAAWDALARGGYASDPALLREGGAIVVFDALTPRFSTRLHHASADFWTEALADGPSIDAVSAHEQQLREDPWLLQLYRERHGFHPLQPFHLWYACQPALRHAGEVIFVGAKRENASRLGARAATRWSDALEIARTSVGERPAVTVVHNTGPMIVQGQR